MSGPGEGAPPGIDPAAARRVGLGLVVLVAAGVAAFLALRRPAGPPPAAIAGDPLLVTGREVYLARCVSCHGAEGKGNGPIAKGLGGSVGDLTALRWKHGDRPEQVTAVVARGVPNTNMAGWKGTLGPSELRAVVGYVYHLAGREVPAEVRGR